MFRVAPPFEPTKRESFFRHKAFRMLLSKARIPKEMIAMKTTKVFPALEWPAAMGSRIPNNRFEQTVGYCTGNVSRGKKAGADDVPCLLDTQGRNG